MGPDFDAGADAFVDTAALMANLDLIVTCDTSIAHLAGALGRPVLVLLQQVADWRWLLDREDCPWYPSMRLIRQSRGGDWSEPLSQAAEALQRLSWERLGRAASPPACN
jgi:ADP-heptose:LPS heptosyltransferase